MPKVVRSKLARTKAACLSKTKVFPKAKPKKNVPWTEIVPLAKVNVAAGQIYAHTAGLGHKQLLHDIPVPSDPSKFNRKQAIIEKIKSNFRDPFTKVNKTLLHKYKCSNCNKSLQVCHKSIPFCNVVLDCKDVIHTKFE